MTTPSTDSPTADPASPTPDTGAGATGSVGTQAGPDPATPDPAAGSPGSAPDTTAGPSSSSSDPKSPDPTSPAGLESRMDKFLTGLERLLGAGGGSSGPAPVTVTPPAASPVATVDTPPVRAPEPVPVSVVTPPPATVIAADRQLKTGDRVTHTYYDDYANAEVTDYGIVVAQDATQVDEGNGVSRLRYSSRVAWLRDVSDPVDDDSLSLQA